MGRQPVWRLVERGEQRRIQAHPDLENGLFGLHHIEVHGAVIVVDSHLDAVAQVVGRSLLRRVWIAIGPGVRVLNPQQMSIQDHLIRVAIEAQEWRRMLDTLLNLAMQQDL